MRAIIRIRFCTAAGATMLATACGGTAGDPDPGAVDKTAIDREALSSALEKQQVYEDQGLMLLRRAWFAPDSYVAQFSGSHGPPILTEVIGKDTLLSGREPAVLNGDETLDAFAERVREAPESLVADMPLDTILFVPREKSAEGTVTEALTDLEAIAQALAQCDAAMKARCAQTKLGYGDTPKTILAWVNSLVDDPNHPLIATQAHAAHATSAFGGVCSHGGGATFSYSIANLDMPSLGTPTSVTHHVNPLNLDLVVIQEGWHEFKFGTGFLGLGTQYDLTFNRADINISAAGFNGAPVETFCGRMTTNATIVERNPCSDTLTCPPFNHP